MSWTDLVLSHGNVAESTLEPTRMTKRMATVLSNGLMEECTLAAGQKESNMVKASTLTKMVEN